MIDSADRSFIHERVDRRMEPFYWILTFEAMCFLIALGIALIAGPVYLVYQFQSWTYLLLLLLLPGAWLVKFSIGYLRAAIRKNRLLSRYRLYADQIAFRIYNHDARTIREDAIPLERVECIYVSKYIAQYHYAYRKSKMTEKQPVFHVLPILYAVYQEGAQRRVVPVPFYEVGEAELWVKELQNRGIPFRATNKLLFPLAEEQQLRLLEDEINSKPFSLERHLEFELNAIVIELEREEAARLGIGNTSESSAKPGGAAVEHTGPRRSSWKPRRSTLAVFALLLVFLLVSIKLADAGLVDEDGTGLCFLVLLVSAAAYQYLAQPLTFRVPLRFLLGSFVLWTFSGAFMPEVEAGPGDEFYSSAIAAVILMAIAIWPLFGIQYWLRRRRRR